VALLAGAAPLAAQLPAPPVVGTGPVQVGGYVGLTLTRPEHPENVEEVEVGELVAAAMAWGQLSQRASYLVELDMAKRTTETWTGRESDRRFDPVRLYLEYGFSDLLRLRAGRFLTPVGQWNERHAEPLTWTPTRPLTTYRPFAKSLTGVLVAGEGSLAGRDAGYAVFWAPSSSLESHFEASEESAFANAIGGRVALEASPGLTVGLGAARLRRSQPRDPEAAEGQAAMGASLHERDNLGAPAAALQEDHESDEREEESEGRVLLGADLRWTHADAELSVEGVWLPSAEEAPYERGLFVQGAFRLAGPVWAVGRGEVYRPVDGEAARLGYAGLTFRGGPHLVVKFGKQLVRHASPRIPDGWFLSFSSLF